MKAFILSLTLFSSSVICSQSVEGLDFMTYPAREIEFKMKAKINWKTNPYKNKVKEIKEGFETGTISFGGNYITVLWLYGADCVQGIMIDSRTGLIYKLPINSLNTSNQCQDRNDIFDRYLFFPTSKLLVTSICKTKKEAIGFKVEQEFYFYLWNEASKKFSLLKKTKKERLDK